MSKPLGLAFGDGDPHELDVALLYGAVVPTAEDDEARPPCL